MGPIKLLFSFCLLAQVSNGFVFSCDEIKRLIQSGTQESTAYVCVILQEGFPNLPFLNTVYLQDQVDKTSNTLATIASQPSRCIKGSSWKVVSDNINDISCDYEISLIFSSTLPSFVLGRNEEHGVAVNEIRTLVVPQAGMRLENMECYGDGDVTFYTGAGQNSGEYLFPLKTWNCDDLPNVYVSFENVISVSSTTTLHFNFTSDYKTGYNLGPGDKAAIVTSGQSDNIQNKHPDENYAIFNLNEEAEVTVNGTMTFDPLYGGSINIQTQGVAENRNETFTGGSIDWIFYGNKFEVRYLTYVAASDIWLNQDKFIIEIDLGDLPEDFTFPPSNDSPTPSTPSTLSTPSTPSASPIKDEYCDCSLDEDGLPLFDSYGIWVDVVIILDTSKSMGNSLDEAIGLITSFVSLLNTDTTTDMFSRVGVIALSDTVDVLYNLNMTSSDDIYVKTTNVDKIDVGAGFLAAQTMFNEGASRPSFRENQRQIIYYMTNSAPGTNLNGVDDFKTNGGIIIVNDFVLEGQAPLPALKTLASDHFFFTDLSDNYARSVQLFCDVNCFCPPDKHNFNDDEKNPRQSANRGCFNPVLTGVPFSKAHDTCIKMNSSLVSIHDDDKQFFVLQVVSSVLGPKKKYWIGYEFDGTQWNWEDKSTNPYQLWDKNDGQPNTNGVKYNCAYALQTTGLNSQWYAANCAAGNEYVCENAPCSSGVNVC